LTDPIRYRLDDLGWYQFEVLVQSLLKAALGLAVESWGGSSDLGRDAYSDHAVRFSDTISLPGPVVFQAKFIGGANATGARSWAALRKAMTAEMHSRHNAGAMTLSSYVLVTNAPLSPHGRSQMTELVKGTFPHASVVLLGARDVCDMLDKQPELRRAFPELLSLRDLDVLISESVNREVLERSRAALEETRDLVPVFVPTTAYARAWEVLEKHSFVVLDGAPEMGKTAIARTIGLTHLFSDWQVIDCHESGDFFQLYSEPTRQIFIADDAFGRTEYDPSLGRGWERSLPKILLRLNSAHRLILTTRKHVLQRGLREMDLAGRAENFPDPAEVVVTATDLTLEERARILYRHAKAISFGAKGRRVVRRLAPAIVEDSNFTPERIRLAIADFSQHIDNLPGSAIDGRLLQTIRHPTERIRLAFQKLTPAHQWILIAFLECDRSGNVGQLERRARILQAVDLESPFHVILDDLIGTFLKQVVSPVSSGPTPILSWIHPSYRDLVIDELARNDRLRWRFFDLMDAVGAAISLTADAGRDERVLISAPRDLARVLERSIAIVEERADSAASILRAMSSYVGDAPHSAADVQEAATKIAAAFSLAIGRGDLTPSGYDLSNVLRSLTSLDVVLPVFDFSEIWSDRCGNVEFGCIGAIPDPVDLDEWVAINGLLRDHYPEIYARDGYVDRAERILELLTERAQAEVQPPWLWTGEESGEYAEKLGVLAESLVELRAGSASVLHALRAKAELYSLSANHSAGGSRTITRPPTATSDFDVKRFFSDL